MQQHNKGGLPLKRKLSRPAGPLPSSPERGTALTCPFCGGTGVRFNLMDSTYYADGIVRIAYFTCSSCSQDWSLRMDI